jgi:hypothetical protein
MMKLRLILLLLFAGLSVYIATGAEYQTNFELLEKIAGELLEEQIKPVFEDKSPVVIWLSAIEPADSSNWFIQNILIKKFFAWGNSSVFIELEAIPDSFTATASENIIQIKYRLNELKIDYEAKTQGIFQSVKRIKRQAKVNFFVQIINYSTRAVIKSGNLERCFRDEVPVAALKNLDLNRVWFTHSKLNLKSFYSRILEPVVMVGATGVIIYLFYSFRSR